MSLRTSRQESRSRSRQGRAAVGGRRVRVQILGAAALVAAGCSASVETSPSVVRTREEVAALAPVHYVDRSQAEGQGVLSLDFGDADLASLIDEALRANPDLQAAAARVAIAEAEARIAGADLYPSLGAGFGGGRSRDVFVGFPLDTPGFRPPLSATYSRLGVSLDLSWELDVWGRLRAGKDAAKGDLEASRAEYAGAWLSLAAQTAKAFLALLEAREQFALAERTLATWSDGAVQVEARYAAGVRPPLDVRLSRTQVAAAEARLAARRSTLERVARQFEILLGRYPSAELSRQVPDAKALAAFPDPQPLPAGIPMDLLERRPDLAGARQRLYAADRRIAAAKASLLPRIALTGSAGTVSDDFAHLLDGDFGVWSWAANMMQPIFEGGRLRGAVRKAEAMASAEQADFVSTALVAFGEVENALADERHLAATEEALARAAVESAAAERLAEQRYRSGIEAYVTLLDARRSALEAASALIDARRRRLENRVDLVLALGGEVGAGSSQKDSDPAQARRGLAVERET